MLDVVVLPWVPATPSTWTSRSTSRASHSGPEVYGNAALEQRFDDRHAARHDIAHHHHVRSRRELARIEARDELDAQRLELRAHGWIDVLVRTGDAMARGLGDGGDAAHERAADAENVNVHDAELCL